MTDETTTKSDTNENPLQLRVTALTDEVFPELMGAPTTRAAMIEAFVSNVRDDSYYKVDRIMEQLLRMRADHMAAEHMKYEGLSARRRFEQIEERIDSLSRAKNAADIKNGLLLQERALHMGLLASALEAIVSSDSLRAVAGADLVAKLQAALAAERRSV